MSKYRDIHDILDSFPNHDVAIDYSCCEYGYYVVEDGESHISDNDKEKVKELDCGKESCGKWKTS